MKPGLKILTACLFLFVLSGCASKYYQVTPEIYRERVKVLGVLPLIVDSESTILHPQREEVVSLLKESARDKYLRLSDHLRDKAGYALVRPVIIDLQSELQLFAEKTIKSNKDGTYRTYQPVPDAVSALARNAGVDGLLVVILNGIDSREKRWERLGPHYVENNFNVIQSTVMVLSTTGEILWEKPGASGKPFMDLQYADFDEAHYNRTDAVAARFITLEGLGRALQATDKGLFNKGIFEKEEFPALYRRLFDELSTALAVGKLWWN